jgi:hypothetical protein
VESRLKKLLRNARLRPTLTFLTTSSLLSPEAGNEPASSFFLGSQPLMLELLDIKNDADL